MSQETHSYLHPPSGRAARPSACSNATFEIGLQVDLHGYHLDVLKQVGSPRKNVSKESDFGALHINLEDVNDTVEEAEHREDVYVAVHLRVHR